MATAEKSLTYEQMKKETALTILYLPLLDGGVSVQAVADSAPTIEAKFGQNSIDEAHILYMEATELLRSRAKIHQNPAEIRRAVETLFAMFRGEKVSAEQIEAVSAPRALSPQREPVIKMIDVDGTSYKRLLVKTRLITMKDRDLLPIIEEFAGRHIQPGDMLFVSEKALSITQGKIIDMGTIKPTWLAYLFARNVSNYYGTSDFHGFGHGTPLAMQLLIEEAGYPRAIFAAAVSAITRPLGIRGLFYSLCGKAAKSVDLPMSFLILEYAHSAKLAPRDASGNAKRFRARFGCETVILDSNYRGAFSLGKSTRAITEKFIGKLFRDNPMGQSDEMTPFTIVRKA
jgi:hypothetical protein